MCVVDWQMLLEYLKVALSWPPMAFLGGLFFVWKFHAQVADFLAGVEQVKAGPLEANRRVAEQQAQAVTAQPFPLPGAGPDEMPRPKHTHEPTQVPETRPAATIGDAEETVDWTIAEEAVKLAPPFPGGNLQGVAQWVHNNPGPTVRDFVMLNAALQAERCFNLIFGTQVELLEYLRLMPGEHLTVDLLSFHEKHLSLVDTPQPLTVPDYLEFLLKQGLMENVGPVGGPKFRLTKFGEHFLVYIKQYYPFIWNQRWL